MKIAGKGGDYIGKMFAHAGGKCGINLLIQSSTLKYSAFTACEDFESWSKKYKLGISHFIIVLFPRIKCSYWFTTSRSAILP